MNYLKFSNKGLLEIEALSLLGASTKRGNDKLIGQFGSGNKFALAYLLRNNYDVKIFRGTEEITISTIEKTFRDQTFSVICFNGKESSITTEFGKDWQLWQALRELYSNCLDEGDAEMDFVSRIKPHPDKTQIYIKNRTEIQNYVSKFDDYFAQNREVIFECDYGRILAKSSNPTLTLFRKGIRCFETEKESIFDYDLNNISIDENRLVSYSWQVPSYIWNLVYQCTDQDVIRQVLFGCKKSNMIEYISSDFNSVNPSWMSEEFKSVLKEIEIAPVGLSGLLSVEEIAKTVVLPNLIFEHAQSVVKNENIQSKFRVYKNGIYRIIDISPLAEATINKALDFFTECNYTNPLQYEIKVARFEKGDILGTIDIDDNCIILSDICISKGIQTVIETIIEEYIHLKYKVKDETRAFQDAAINEIVNVLKMKNAYLV